MTIGILFADFKRRKALSRGVRFEILAEMNYPRSKLRGICDQTAMIGVNNVTLMSSDGSPSANPSVSQQAAGYWTRFLSKLHTA